MKFLHPMDLQDLQGHLANLDKMAFLAKTVRPDLLDPKDHLVTAGNPDHLENQEATEREEQMENKEELVDATIVHFHEPLLVTKYSNAYSCKL